jgi:hypothetical protein
MRIARDAEDDESDDDGCRVIVAEIPDLRPASWGTKDLEPSHERARSTTCDERIL